MVYSPLVDKIETIDSLCFNDVTSHLSYMLAILEASATCSGVKVAMTASAFALRVSSELNTDLMFTVFSIMYPLFVYLFS
jgi:hypothetical protein